jgi:putative endonuclease
MKTYDEMLGSHTYYVYILTNKYRTTFYIGVTNNLSRRLCEHHLNLVHRKKTFAARYNIQYLVFFERFSWIQNAIAREKELKKWRREKKLALIREFNPEFQFLNHLFM